MTSTFSPPRPPVLGSGKTVSYRTKNSGFGDGYVQRAADGINNKLVSWDLSWSALTPADAQAIEDFFDSLAGYLAFFYTVSGDIERKYTAGGFNRVLVNGKTDSFKVTITQVFDP